MPEDLTPYCTEINFLPTLFQELKCLASRVTRGTKKTEPKPLHTDVDSVSVSKNNKKINSGFETPKT